MSLLQKLRILDADGTVSLTNIMMIILCVRVGVAPQLDLETVAALFLALASYNGKKVLHKLKADKELQTKARDDGQKAELDHIKSELKNLTQIINLRK